MRIVKVIKMPRLPR